MYIFVSYVLFVIITTSLNLHNNRSTEINHCNRCVPSPLKIYYVTEWFDNLDIGDMAFSAASLLGRKKDASFGFDACKSKITFWRRKMEFHIIHTYMIDTHSHSHTVTSKVPFNITVKVHLYYCSNWMNSITSNIYFVCHKEDAIELMEYEGNS